MGSTKVTFKSTQCLDRRTHTTDTSARLVIMWHTRKSRPYHTTAGSIVRAITMAIGCLEASTSTKTATTMCSSPPTPAIVHVSTSWNGGRHAIVPECEVLRNYRTIDKNFLCTRANYNVLGVASHVSNCTVVWCIAGCGFQTRAASSAAMIERAVRVAEARGEPLAPLAKVVTFNIGDEGCRKNGQIKFDLAYTSHCQERMVPDFTFYRYPEVRG